MNTTPNNGSTDCSPQMGYCAPALPSPFARRTRLDELEARNAARRARMSFGTSRRLAAELGCIPDDEDIIAEIDHRQMKPHYYR